MSHRAENAAKLCNFIASRDFYFLPSVLLTILSFLIALSSRGRFYYRIVTVTSDSYIIPNILRLFTLLLLRVKLHSSLVVNISFNSLSMQLFLFHIFILANFILVLLLHYTLQHSLSLSIKPITASVVRWDAFVHFYIVSLI